MFEITNLFQLLYICLHTQPKNNFINTSPRRRIFIERHKN